jgi:hypothetical protein
MLLVLGEVAGERRRQEDRFPGQDLPDGTTGGAGHELYADVIRAGVDEAAFNGTLTWWDVLHEEWAEAGAEDAPQSLRAELIQVAAVAVRWIEAIDRRAAETRLAA